MLVSEGVDISYYPCVSQVQKGVVYYGVVGGRGVEDAEVSIARGGAVEVCMRERTSMERGPISGGELRSFPLQRNTIPNRMIPDEFRNLFFSIFVDEDKRVVTGVAGVVFIPSFPRMDDLLVIADRDVRWSGELFKECLWLLLFFFIIRVDAVGEGWDVCEVCDAIVLSIGDGKGDRSIMFRHRFDEGFKVFCDHINVVSCLWVVRLITDDGFAEGNGVVNLGLGRVYRFEA